MKRKCAFFGLAAITVLVSPLACGGIDEPDFFDSSGGTSSVRDSGTSSADSGHGGTTDAGTVVFVDSGTTTFDAAPPPPVDPGIFCGTGTYCEPSSQFCCATDQDLGAPQFACGTDKNDCTDDPLGDGVVIPCDKTSECGGQFCCGQFQEGSPNEYTQVRCQSSCNGANARIFCDPANGDADCAGTGTCGTSSTLPGFHVCTK